MSIRRFGGHGLVVGATSSGKSFFSKMITSAWDGEVIVYDPIASSSVSALEWGEKATVVNSDDSFNEVITERNKRGSLNLDLVVFDEASETLQRNSPHTRFFTRGRHDNFVCLALTQRYNGVAPLVRDNVKYACLFRLSRGGAKLAIEEFTAFNKAYASANEAVSVLNGLETGEFVLVEQGGKYRAKKVIATEQVARQVINKLAVKSR